ncbi:MAG: nickel pincer cofactor biosynthesis protein LarC [Acidobacteria bacterium]|nr:nickel pincer cofactor biosynthesis protein LarC [Acidobacteriota bacterium]
MADRTVAWFHCFSGIAGDMALGSLLDAGADLDAVLGMLQGLGVEGWSLTAEPVLRGGVAGTRALVTAEDTTVVRTYANICSIIENASLPDRVRERALAVFGAIARVESELHRRELAQVHFHEVGGIDAIVDVVGVAAALEVLGIDEIASSPVATGMGMVRTAHGLLPNPAPAVVSLLEGAPTYGIDIGVELTTPTGAGILAALATSWGPLPAMTISASGFGAGSREFADTPNMTQVVVGTAATTGRSQGQPVVLLEANVDDATGETLAHAISALLAAGAHDAWITPIVMKKGRPAHTVSALADPALAGTVSDVLRKETGTLGVRGSTIDRWPAARTLDAVEVHGHNVRVKVTAGRVKVEHDDAAAAADATGLPVREVVSLAEEAWRRRPDPSPA